MRRRHRTPEEQQDQVAEVWARELPRRRDRARLEEQADDTEQEPEEDAETD